MRSELQIVTAGNGISYIGKNVVSTTVAKRLLLNRICNKNETYTIPAAAIDISKNHVKLFKYMKTLNKTVEMEKFNYKVSITFLNILPLTPM